MSEVKNTKCVLFSGPIMSGKDTAVDYIVPNMQSNLLPAVKRECKDHLHTLTRSLFCVSPERYWEIYNDRKLKEKPLKDFRVTLNPLDNSALYGTLGNEDFMDKTEERNPEYDCKWYSRPRLNPYTANLSIREAMIYVSEVICKPRFSSNYFGEVRAKQVQDNEIVFDASAAAFDINGEVKAHEIYPLIDRVGEDNILVVRIHRDGYTFDGDSRRYVPDGTVHNIVDVHNNGTLDEFIEECSKVVGDFLYD